MQSLTGVSSAIVENDIDALIKNIVNLTDLDLEVVTEYHVTGKTMCEQDAFIIACVLGGRHDVLKKIIDDLVKDVFRPGSKRTELKIKRALSGFSVYSYFVYENTVLLNNFLDLQILVMDTIPVIPKDLFGCEDIKGMKHVGIDLLSQFLARYYSHYGKYSIEFYSFDDSESFHEGFFRHLLDLPEFIYNIDFEKSVTLFEEQHCVLGLTFLMESQGPGYYENRYARSAQIVQERMKTFECRKQGYEQLMKELSKSVRIASVVFKNELEPLFSFFDFDEMIKKNPESFII